MLLDLMLANRASRVRALVAASAIVAVDHDAVCRRNERLDKYDSELCVFVPEVSDCGKLSYEADLNHIVALRWCAY